MSTGFKYLGYFIKPSGYLVKDWLWLIKKFENRITHWSYKLLSLGGRLVLIKAVLTSIPVFWMALVPIPKAILGKLKSLIFISFGAQRGTRKSFIWLTGQHYPNPLLKGAGG